MPTQVLNETQVAFVNETIRPMLESLVKFKFRLDAFILDYDNQQTQIVEDGDDLGDNDAGTAPRTGVPTLTGTRLSQLRTVAGNMQSQLDGPTLNILISLLARDLNTVIGG